ncbi:protein S40-7-like [Lycium barbarum]|uniref:protein S40-7-like n=1 Tax=Lycium barbarum TaxID=112863 RepID=UPI00293E854E|nr:protein S40-7-like [Lycium barbarum]
MPSPITTKTSSSSASSSIRFMGLLKQPDSDPNNNNILEFEFDENDVYWSDSPDSTISNSFSPPTPTRHLPQRATLYKPSNSGLSAALSDDHHPLIRRKSTLNPSVSATSAAKMIPPVFRSENSNPNSFPKFHQSAPVNVPVWQKKDGPVGGLDRFDEVDDDVEDEEMVPPHVMVAQSHVTFSVFEGVGRTLKGRDLRRVRNAVFQKTGFID